MWSFLQLNFWVLPNWFGWQQPNLLPKVAKSGICEFWQRKHEIQERCNFIIECQDSKAFFAGKVSNDFDLVAMLSGNLVRNSIILLLFFMETAGLCSVFVLLLKKNYKSALDQRGSTGKNNYTEWEKNHLFDPRY